MKKWILIVLLSTINFAHLFSSEELFIIKRPTHKLSVKERIKKNRNLISGVHHDLKENADDILTQAMLRLNVQPTISLHKAIETSQSIQTIAEIVAKTRNPDIVDKYNDTPLLCAIEKSVISAFTTPECRASHINRTKTIIDLLLQHGAHINHTDAYGNTPLFKAIHTIDCPSEIIAHLINRGAHVNHRNNKLNTPLLDVINNQFVYGFRSKFDHIKVLLQNGVDINAQNADGDTACHLLMKITAKALIKENIFSALFDYGAKTEIYNNNNQTCIDIAMDNETIINDGFDIVTFIEEYHNKR